MFFVDLSSIMINVNKEVIHMEKKNIIIFLIIAVLIVSFSVYFIIIKKQEYQLKAKDSITGNEIEVVLLKKKNTKIIKNIDKTSVTIYTSSFRYHQIIRDKEIKNYINIKLTKEFNKPRKNPNEREGDFSPPMTIPTK